MQKTSRDLLDKGVNILKSLGFSPDDIIVTGSVALDLQGVLPEYRKVHDLDFIIKMDDITWKYLKLFAAIYEYGNDEYHEEYKERRDFQVDGVKFNVWRDVRDEKSINCVTLKDDSTGVWINPVRSIIYKKKSYGRPKDFKDIQEICKNIL